MVKVIADSTCDLSKELIQRYNIEIVPLFIHLGDKEFKDGVDITPDEIFEWSDKNNKTPKTSAVSMEECLDAIGECRKTDDDAIIFTISAEMSNTINVFRLAAQDLEYEDHVRVVDSKNLSTGIGLLVIEAAVMAQVGKSLDDIYKHIDALIPKVRASFVVDILTYLHRGGRCSATAAMIGGVLNLKPQIYVEDGKMFAGKKYRGASKKVLMQYVKKMQKICTYISFLTCKYVLEKME